VAQNTEEAHLPAPFQRSVPIESAYGAQRGRRPFPQSLNADMVKALRMQLFV
jgi:hypothetical protein